MYCLEQDQRVLKAGNRIRVVPDRWRMLAITSESIWWQSVLEIERKLAILATMASTETAKPSMKAVKLFCGSNSKEEIAREQRLWSPENRSRGSYCVGLMIFPCKSGQAVVTTRKRPGTVPCICWYPTMRGRQDSYSPKSFLPAIHQDMTSHSSTSRAFSRCPARCEYASKADAGSTICYSRFGKSYWIQKEKPGPNLAKFQGLMQGISGDPLFHRVGWVDCCRVGQETTFWLDLYAKCRAMTNPIISALSRLLCVGWVLALEPLRKGHLKGLWRTSVRRQEGVVLHQSSSLCELWRGRLPSHPLQLPKQSVWQLEWDWNYDLWDAHHTRSLAGNAKARIDQL